MYLHVYYPLKRFLLFASFLFSLACNNKGDNTATKDSDTPTSDSSSIIREDSLDTELAGLPFCTEKLPYPNKKITRLYEVDTLISNTNKQNKDPDTSLKPVKGQEKQYISFLQGFVWNKNALLVQFLDGDPAVQQRVIETVKEWERACAVHFTFGQFTNPDITVSFSDGGYWSNIGSDSKGRVPSMSLTGLTANQSQDEYNRVVLHEFGHALGFIHEHQVPGFDIPWDIDRVERYYKVNYGWDAKMVYDNIIFKYEFDQVNGSAFDPASIMIYAIPRGLMKDRTYSIPWPSQLSSTDKRIVAERYK